MSDRTKTASCYLTIGRDKRGSRRFPELVIRNMTKTKPSLKPGELAIKVNVELPASVFEQAVPEATISLPEDALHVVPHVTADGVPVVVDDEGTSS